MLQFTLINIGTEFESYEVSGYQSGIKHAVVPAVHNGLPVTQLHSNVFSNCSTLMEVILPNSINSISTGAFAYCYSLNYISIPDGVTSIGESAFQNCYLESIVIPNTIQQIGDSAFAYADYLMDIYYDGSETEWNNITIGSGNNRLSKDKITFNSDVSSYSFVKTNRFSYTLTNHHEVINLKMIDKSITTIDFEQEFPGLTISSFGANAFSSSSLSSITIPDTVERIGMSAFSSCTHLTSIDIPDSVIYMGNLVFTSCYNLQQANLSSNLKTISPYTFQGTGLVYVTIPDGVTSIGERAFSSSDLSYITIPDSVTQIASEAFVNCSSLANVFYAGSEIQWNNIIIGSQNDCLYDACFEYNSIVDEFTPVSTSAFSYLLTNDNKVVNFVMKDKTITTFNFDQELPGLTILSLGKNAFESCYNLTSVSLPNTVNSIGYSAFSYCRSLSTISIPDGVTNIQSYTFNGCSSLNIEKLPSNIKTIGSGAFYGCESISYLIIPNTVEKIWRSAFCNCFSLVNVFYNGTESEWNNIDIGIENSCLLNAIIEYESEVYSFTPVETSRYSYLLSDDGRAFGFVMKDKTITSFDFSQELPSVRVVSIGKSGFYNCQSLSSITLPNTINSIAAKAFESCKSLSSITLPNSITIFGGYIFKGCAFTSIPNLNGCSSLPTGMFSNCLSFETITISNSFTSIGKCAFEQCNNLTSVTIPNTVTNINEQAFRGCINLQTVNLPSNLSIIESQLFDSCISLASITIPSSVTQIKLWAFTYCTSLETINYEGTVNQWNSITKGSGWNNSVPATTVHCSDGDVNL